MVQAWFMDEEKTDQRLEHHRNPPQYISLEDLFQKTGVEYFKVSSFCVVSTTLIALLSVVFFLIYKQIIDNV